METNESKRTPKQRENWEAMRAWVERNGLYPQRGGATITSFCQVFSIDMETYRNWMEDSNNSAFSEMVRKANEVFDKQFELQLVGAVRKKALGYEDMEEIVEGKPDKNGDIKTQKIIRKKRNVPADMGAASFLLANMYGERWKNPLRVEASVQGGIEVSLLSPEEAKKKLETIKSVEIKNID